MGRGPSRPPGGEALSALSRWGPGAWRLASGEHFPIVGHWFPGCSVSSRVPRVQTPLPGSSPLKGRAWAMKSRGTPGSVGGGDPRDADPGQLQARLPLKGPCPDTLHYPLLPEARGWLSLPRLVLSPLTTLLLPSERWGQETTVPSRPRSSPRLAGLRDPTTPSLSFPG